MHFEGRVDHVLKCQWDEGQVDKLSSSGKACGRVNTDFGNVEPGATTLRQLEGSYEQAYENERRHVPLHKHTQSTEKEKNSHRELASDKDGSAANSANHRNSDKCCCCINSTDHISAL